MAPAIGITTPERINWQLFELSTTDKGWTCDSIILTGGGSGLLYPRLLPILKQERVILADDLDTIHLANVRGGLKLWRLYEALKLV